MFTDSLRINQSLHNEKGVAECLVGLAWVENAHGRHERAARFLAMHERLREAIHAPLPEDDRAEYDALVTLVQKGLDRATFESAWANGRKRTFEQAVAEALVSDEP
jgi:hypothetical protein